ncbi:MAG: hypothetical protein QXU32_13170 [Nitrososphaerales archaeon]
MGTKTIKDVDEKTWEILKEMAKKKKVKMGTLLRYMVNRYKRLESVELKQFVLKEPIISTEEAEELEKAVKVIRKEYGFRQ